MKKIKIKSSYITLGQFLKYTGVASSGYEAKMIIQDGLVEVNNEIETRRGKKLRVNDQIIVNTEAFEII